ncbi:MAG TPA: hypothetical protein VF768_01445 [Holophagaceae bacterium]
MRSVVLIAAMALAAPLMGGDLPIAIQAKFVKILVSTMNSTGKVYVKDSKMIDELKPMGVAADDASKVAWASSEAEVKHFKASGKLVICGKLEWLAQGGAVAIVEENGKPQIYLHMGNIAGSGVTVSDAVLRIAKRM